MTLQDVTQQWKDARHVTPITCINVYQWCFKIPNTHFHIHANKKPNFVYLTSTLSVMSTIIACLLHSNIFKIIRMNNFFLKLKNDCSGLESYSNSTRKWP